VKWRNPDRLLSKFHLFSSLPPELRLKIWKHAFPRPRILQLSFQIMPSPWNSQDNSDSIIASDDFPATFLKQSHSLLKTCRESRTTFLESYIHIKFLGSSMCQINSLRDEDGRSELSDIGSTRSIDFYHKYFDRQRDILLIHSQCVKILQDYGPMLDLSRIENLALSNDDWHGSPQPSFGSPRFIWDFVQGYPNLKTLRIVLGCTYQDSQSYLGHFLDIDNKFTSMLAEPTDNERRLTPRQRSHQLKNYLERATSLRSQFGKTVPPATTSLEFKVCLFASMSGASIDVVKYQKMFLVPVTPKYYGVTYFTWKPSEKVPVRDGQHSLSIEELGCDAQCDENGKLLTSSGVLDGDILRRLFKDSGF